MSIFSFTSSGAALDSVDFWVTHRQGASQQVELPKSLTPPQAPPPLLSSKHLLIPPPLNVTHSLQLIVDLPDSTVVLLDTFNPTMSHPDKREAHDGVPPPVQEMG